MSASLIKPPVMPAMEHAIVPGPLGEPLSLACLPDPQERWVPRMKAQIVAAVEGGLLSLEEACSRYALSKDEFIAWQSAIERTGLPGLRVTKVQHYRHAQGQSRPRRKGGKKYS